MLQTLIDNTATNGVLDLSGQTFTVDHTARINITRPFTIIGGTVVVPGNTAPTGPLFELSLLPNGSRVEFRNTTITGPDTTGWDANLDVPHGAINWVKKQTWDSTLIVESCTITGGYGGAVIRNGGGRLDITDSTLSGWVYGVAFFEGHGGHGSLTMRNTTLAAPDHSKQSSIGAYIHPHLDARFDTVTASDWNRFAVYFNGTPQSTGHHDLAQVDAVNCALVQTGSSSVTTLLRCSETGVVANGGRREQRVVAERLPGRLDGRVGDHRDVRPRHPRQRRQHRHPLRVPHRYTRTRRSPPLQQLDRSTMGWTIANEWVTPWVIERLLGG